MKKLPLSFRLTLSVCQSFAIVGRFCPIEKLSNTLHKAFRQELEACFVCSRTCMQWYTLWFGWGVRQWVSHGMGSLASATLLSGDCAFIQRLQWTRRWWHSNINIGWSIFLLLMTFWALCNAVPSEHFLHFMLSSISMASDLNTIYQDQKYVGH